MKCIAFSGGDFRIEDGVGYNILQGFTKLGYTLEQNNPRALSLPHLPVGDVYISNGLRDPGPEIVDILERKGRDLMIYDLGYMLRARSGFSRGYYQLGLNRIGWVPNFECPSDRFDNLGLEIKPLTVDRSNKRVLVCAQKPGDAQHRMNDVEMNNWCRNMCLLLERDGYTPVYRPHPMQKHMIDGYEVSEHATLQEAVSTCQFMVTYNSTSGVEALLEGKPVVVADPDCHYKEVSSYLEEDGSLSNIPTEDQLKNYFYRLAYAQWKLSEIRTGLPFQFLIKYMNGNDPFKGMDYTIHQPVEQKVISAKISIESKEGVPSAKEEAPQEGVPSYEEFMKSLEGLKWFAKRAAVKELTGELPRNMDQLERLVKGHYNG